MNLDDLKDQLKAQWEQLKGNIQESPAYHIAKEKYDNLPARGQKSLIIGLSIGAIFILLSIPYSFYSTSSDNVTQYEEDRELIRELFKASRLGSAGFQPPPLKGPELVSRVQSIINNVQLLSDQIGEIKTVEIDTLGAPIAPNTIQQEAAVAQVSKLNLIQIKEIAFKLQNISAGVKLTGMDIIASPGKENYFDVTYKIISFYLEEKKEEDNSKRPRSKKRGN